MTPLNEKYSDVFDNLDFKTQRGLVDSAFYWMAGDWPTRSEVIACRLLSSLLVFREDKEGAVIADYTTVLRLCQSFGEQMLKGLLELELEDLDRRARGVE